MDPELDCPPVGCLDKGESEVVAMSPRDVIYSEDLLIDESPSRNDFNDDLQTRGKEKRKKHLSNEFNDEFELRRKEKRKNLKYKRSAKGKLVGREKKQDRREKKDRCEASDRQLLSPRIKSREHVRTSPVWNDVRKLFECERRTGTIELSPALRLGIFSVLVFITFASLQVHSLLENMAAGSHESHLRKKTRKMEEKQYVDRVVAAKAGKLFSNMADFPSPPSKDDTPVFWHIPRSGGSTVKAAICSCMGLTLASEVGGQNGHGSDEMLQVVERNGNKFVNVDTTTVEGLKRAKKLGLASSGIADAVVVSHLNEVNDVFTKQNKGRIFTLMRHPVDRAASMFYYIQDAAWEPTYHGHLKNMTLEEYAISKIAEDNWLTRFLSGRRKERLSELHLELAKEVLRTKFLVGLVEEIDESFRRFQMYFDWRMDTLESEYRETRQQCVNDYITGRANKSDKKNRLVSENSHAYYLLLWHNKYDVKLYEYAKELFEEQAQEFI